MISAKKDETFQILIQERGRAQNNFAASVLDTYICYAWKVAPGHWHIKLSPKLEATKDGLSNVTKKKIELIPFREPQEFSPTFWIYFQSKDALTSG